MIQVIKANGDKEEFSEEKMRDSIRRAGIPRDLQEYVLSHIKERLFDGIKTAELYSHVMEFLNKQEPFAKAKYSLKHAIMALGPTGYPFEDFIAQIVRTDGYDAQVRTILQGSCINHEVDVIAESRNRENKIMVEAKYHNLPGNKTNVHVALYTKARFDDVKERYGFSQAWLVTNTKVTSDAIAYAECMGMKITSWSYPDGESLREIIERSGLSPITSLSTLSQRNKEDLARKNIILSRDISNNPSSLENLKLSNKEIERVMEEAAYISRH